MNEITLNPRQVEAVCHRDGPLIVLSVAGTGKSLAGSPVILGNQYIEHVQLVDMN